MGNDHDHARVISYTAWKAVECLVTCSINHDGRERQGPIRLGACNDVYSTQD